MHIRLYTDFLDDPKLSRLTEPAKLRFIELLLLAGECDNAGYLQDGDRPLTVENIAWRLRLPLERLTADLAELQAAGLLANDAGAWLVVNFAKRQGPSQDEKRQYWRDLKRRQRLASSPPPPVPTVVLNRTLPVLADTLDAVLPVPLNKKENKNKKVPKSPPPHSQTSKPATLEPSTALAHFQRTFEDYPLTRPQARTLSALEIRYGSDRLLECIDWAANTGIEARRAVQAIKSALPTWQTRKAPSPAPNLAKDLASIDPDLEYLRLNPNGPGRDAALARLQSKGLPPPPTPAGSASPLPDLGEGPGVRA